MGTCSITGDTFPTGKTDNVGLIIITNRPFSQKTCHIRKSSGVNNIINHGYNPFNISLILRESTSLMLLVTPVLMAQTCC